LFKKKSKINYLNEFSNYGITCENSEFGERLYSWLESEKLSILYIAKVLEMVGIKLPAQLSNWGSFGTSSYIFTCSDVNSVKTDIVLHNSWDENPPEIRILEKTGNTIYQLNRYEENGNIEPKLTLLTKRVTTVTSRDNKELSGEYENNFFHTELVIDGYELSIRIQGDDFQKDGKKYQIYEERNGKLFEEYLMTLDSSLDIFDVYENLVKIFELSEKEVSQYNFFSIELKKRGKITAKVISKITFEKGKRTYITAFEEGQIFAVSKDNSWKYEFEDKINIVGDKDFQYYSADKVKAQYYDMQIIIRPLIEAKISELMEVVDVYTLQNYIKSKDIKISYGTPELKKYITNWFGERNWKYWEIPKILEVLDIKLPVKFSNLEEDAFNCVDSENSEFTVVLCWWPDETRIEIWKDGEVNIYTIDKEDDVVNLVKQERKIESNVNGNLMEVLAKYYHKAFHIELKQKSKTLFVIDIVGDENYKFIKNHKCFQAEDYLLNLPESVSILEVFKEIKNIFGYTNNDILNLKISLDNKNKGKLVINHGKLRQFSITKNDEQITINGETDWDYMNNINKIKISYRAEKEAYSIEVLGNLMSEIEFGYIGELIDATEQEISELKMMVKECIS